jgi:hypothetical protein
MGLLNHFKASLISAFEACVGVGIERDRAHRLAPKLRTHLLQWCDCCFKGVLLSTRPSAGQGIVVLMLLA